MSQGDATSADALIIGGGFTGLIAARELRKEGRNSIVLEARDRLGGRVWTEERLGFKVELGGTWVHWTQPHSWAELTRYGIETAPSPEPERLGWVPSGGENTWYAYEDFFALFDAGQKAFMADAREVQPLPHRPFENAEAMAKLDSLSVADRLRELGLSGDEYDRNYTLWSMNFHAPGEDGGLTQAIRWSALGNWDWFQLLQACSTYKVVGGMTNWVNLIAADAEADVRFDTQVTAVEQGENAVTVRTKDGTEYRGQTAIVAVPLNNLKDIEFQPGLDPKVAKLAEEGQASRGLKLWIRVKGKLAPSLALAALPSPITLMQTEYWDDDSTMVVAFAIEEKLDPDDREAVEAAFRQWIPDAEVDASTGHSWLNDEFSRGTWGMLRPNQLEGLKAAQDRSSRVILAGSDLALGWGGFVDGAIESGIRAASASLEQIDPAAQP